METLVTLSSFSNSIPCKANKNQVIQLIRGKMKQTAQNRVERVSHNANIIKVGFMSGKLKALVYEPFDHLQRDYWHSKKKK